MKTFFTVALTTLVVGVVGFSAYQVLSNKYDKLKIDFDNQMVIVNDLTTKLAASEIKETEIRKKATEDQEVLTKEIARLKLEKDSIRDAYLKEKAKTATLTNSELVSAISIYIGPEISELKIGGFSLTRMGGENSLNLFKDLSFSLVERKKDAQIIINYEKKIDNYTTVIIPSYERQLKDTKQTLSETQTALNICNDLVKEKARKQFWKGLAYGVGGTAVVTVIFSLVRGLTN